MGIRALSSSTRTPADSSSFRGFPVAVTWAPPSLAEHGELSCFRISDKVFSEPTSPGVKLDALAHTTAVRQGTVILQEAAAGDLVGFSNADTVYIRLHVLGHDAHIDQG